MVGGTKGDGRCLAASAVLYSWDVISLKYQHLLCWLWGQDKTLLSCLFHYFLPRLLGGQDWRPEIDGQAMLEDNVVCVCFQTGSHVVHDVLELAMYSRRTLKFWSCLTCCVQVCFMESWRLNSGPHMNARQLLYYLNYISSREKIWLIVIYKFEASSSIHYFKLVHK